MGFRMVLHRRSLLERDRCERRPKSQYILVRVTPGKLTVQVESEVFYLLLAGDLHVVHVHRWALACASGVGNVDGFEGVGLHTPGAEPGLDTVKVGLEVKGSYCWVTI
jgi:hypothetical protein